MTMMRIISTILIVQILFLIIDPSMSKISNKQCKKACCEVAHSKNHKTPEKNNCCKNGACNPFMICCNCYALIMQPQVMKFPVVYLSKEFWMLTEINQSIFFTDKWQPPETV